MLDNDDSSTTPGTGATDGGLTATGRPRRRRAASRPAGPPEPVEPVEPVAVASEPETGPADTDADADLAVAEAQDAAVDGPEGEVPAEAPVPTSVTTPVFTQVDAPPATTRSRRRATAAAGPPVADLFTAAQRPSAAAPVPASSPEPTVTAAPGEAEQAAEPAAPTRARRGRRRPAAEAAEAAEQSTGDAVVEAAAVPDPGQGLPGLVAPSDDPAAARAATAGAGEDDAPARPRRTRRRAASPVTTPADLPTDLPTVPTDLQTGLSVVPDVDVPAQGDPAPAAVDGPSDGAGADDRPEGRGVPDLATLADLVAGQDPSGTEDEDEDDPSRPRRGRSRRRRGGRGRGSATGSAETGDESDDADDAGSAGDDDTSVTPDETPGATQGEGGRGRSPRRRGRGSGRGRGGAGSQDDAAEDDDEADLTQGASGGERGAATADEGADESADEGADEGADDGDGDDDTDDTAADGDDAAGSRSSRRRRRRRRRSGGGDADLVADPDDPPGTIVRIRESRLDEVTKVKGSTRLEAKRQRRRDGRGASRKRTVITEAEFLTRRESVDRTLLVRQGEDRTEIAVLEDGVLVEHHVTRASQQSMIGNVYLGKVQNVLPSMEAAFVDIGRGRNAVLYAGEVNWDAVGLTNGAQRKIEDALKPGDPVLAQVTKDPVGHKGARLTAQVSLPGRYLVYVPGSSMTGISRKLPETERTRLKKVLRRVVPEDAGVIVRTAAEGASETELERDVARLQAQWEDIEKKSTAVQAPARLYSEPDLAIKVVRDVFNEDFTRLVVSGDDTWDTLDGYVRHVAPDLAERMTRWAPEEGAEQDLFVHHRIDEQIAKALDRKVWLPSGGSLVIDRTEAMTVVDVNTGKYTGNGGNLEETVTRNNLEAAEEIVRQLRLRDIGGIIVVDFIDMVLESNRNLVLRRLVECLGRDRTKHQVAEVTSLGLVQLTRKRVGSGLLESFSTPCEHCQGRGLITHDEPIGAGNELPSGPGDGGGRGAPGGSGSGSGSGSGGGTRRRGGRSGG